MRVEVDVCTDDGWQHFATDEATPLDITQCIALKPKDCRASYWRIARGLNLPQRYRALIWRVVWL